MQLLYKVDYLRLWFGQKVFWYSEMIQLVLVWVSKPTQIKTQKIYIHIEKWVNKETRTLANKQALHVFNIFLSSLLVNEVSQGSWDIKVLWPFFTHLLVREIYILREQIKQVQHVEMLIKHQK